MSGLLRALRPLPVWSGALRRVHLPTRPLRVADDVKAALADGEPVVALESTIITHGMKWPENLELAQRCEQIVRDNGAIPATVAVLDGELHVGLESDQVTRLALAGKSAHKVSKRDLPIVTARKMTGGTTVAATMILAHMAGIRVFSTGGIGGVHRHAEYTMDISADLLELGRTPVAVVCAGPKSILDIPKTLEVLETQGVTVTTMGPEGTPFPAFFARDSGLKSPFTSESASDVARLLWETDALNLRAGTLVANPIPHADAIDDAVMRDIIDQAVREASEQGVGGKEATPFLLSRVAELTKGDSVRANLALVFNNCAMGAQIAREYSRMARATGSASSSSTFLGQRHYHTDSRARVRRTPFARSFSCKHALNVPMFPVAVVGGVAVDTTSTIDHKTAHVTDVLYTSNMGTTHSAVGGVARNIAQAVVRDGCNALLITAVGGDAEGSQIVRQLARDGMDVRGIYVAKDSTSAHYTAVNAASGDLVVAVADMRIFEQNPPAAHVEELLRREQPQWVAIDGNLASELTRAAVNAARAIGAKVLFEPTSVPKCSKAFVSAASGSGPLLDVITPNVYELAELHRLAKESGMCETFSRQIEGFEKGITRMMQLAPGLDESVIEQAVALLPLFPHMFVKLGAKGVLELSSSPLNDGDDIRMETSTVHVRYHAPLPVEDSRIKSVSGAGDSFTGALLSQLVASREHMSRTCVDAAQRAAVASLYSMDTVPATV